VKKRKGLLNRLGLEATNSLSVRCAKYFVAGLWILIGLSNCSTVLWAYDYHLKFISPCIDAGDPASDYSNEPAPNGGRINLGAYGNTSEATCSYPYLNDDNDSDGMPNWYETEKNFNPDNAADGGGVRQFVLDYMTAHSISLPSGFNPGNYPFSGINETNDPDNDSLTNLEEYLLGTDPHNGDMDDDSLPDGWEIANNLDPSDADDAWEDADGDGASNYEEYVAGTDPNDPGSVLEITDVNRGVPDEGQVTISWSSVPGAFYDIYFSDDPVSNQMRWTLAVGEYPAEEEGTITSWTDDGSLTGSTPTSSRHYEVGIHDTGVIAPDPEVEDTWSVMSSGNYALSGGRPNMGGNRRLGPRFLDVDSVGDSAHGIFKSAHFKVWSGIVASMIIDTAASSGEMDSDGDGLPDSWEIAHGLNPYSAWGDDGANGDPDGDGMTNLEEYLAGTDPNDDDSVFEVTDVDRDVQGQVTITWSSAPGMFYDIYFSDEPMRNEMEWLLAVGTYPSQGETTSWTDDGSLTGSAPTSSRHYMITVNAHENPSVITDGIETWYLTKSSSFAISGPTLNMGGDRRTAASFKLSDLVGDSAAGTTGSFTVGLSQGSMAANLSDNDGDGIIDSEEIYRYHADPDLWDTDGDGMAD